MYSIPDYYTVDVSPWSTTSIGAWGLSYQGISKIIVKLRQGSGKDWQGMALNAKGLKA